MEEEKKVGEQLSAHGRRPRSTPASTLEAGIVCQMHSASLGFSVVVSFPVVVPEAQRERGQPHTAGENKARWPGAPPLGLQRLRRLLLSQLGQLGRACGHYGILSVTHLRRNK